MTIEDSGEVVQENTEVTVEAQPEQVTELQADIAEAVETAAQDDESSSQIQDEQSSPENSEQRADAQSSEELPQGPQLTDAQKVGLLEALLLASGDPLPISRIEELLLCKKDDVLRLAETLKQAYADEARGLELVLVAAKLQLRTKPMYAEYVRQLIAVKPRKLSQAALETLAVIAYQQPVVKSEVDKIRGVDVAPTIKTLLERKLIKIIGYQASVGQPALYGTTEDFLSIFGLSALSELPSLRDLKALVKEPGEALEEGSESVEEDESLEASDSESGDEATPVEGEEPQPLAQ